MDGSKVMVLGDASKIVQVLTNLIVNSINYGTEGGRTEVRYYDAEDSILVEVPTRGLAFGKKTCRGCSSGSTAWTSRVLATPAARVWGWPFASTHH